MKTRLLPVLRRRLALRPDDLLRDAVYRRLWSSILISSFGGQVTMLALPLTAALLLRASPTQMGWLTAIEIAPFVLFSLPAGVWLDRVRKLPVYVAGETLLAFAVASVPFAWWAGWLTMPWLYGVGFLIGTVYTVAGSAAQVVLTQVVPRERLVEAHARNALASSGAEVAGPGLAGVLIRLVGAPLALLVDAAALLASALILRGVRVVERRSARAAGASRAYGPELREGLRFVARQRLLVALALTIGLWQMAFHAAMVVQILFATRRLGLGEQGVGLSYVGLGVGTVAASVFGDRLSRRLGPGRALIVGVATCGVGWLTLSLAPGGAVGIAAFAAMLLLFGFGAVLIFINFLALRQAVTPEPLLGRMTSTMRWLTVAPAAPGALIGGWLGEHWSLRAALAFAGGLALLAAANAWRLPVLRELRALPTPTLEPESGPDPLPAPAAGALASVEAV
ncbi:MAG: MFS transporter [Rubrivivax sp.]